MKTLTTVQFTALENKAQIEFFKDGGTIDDTVVSAEVPVLDVADMFEQPAENHTAPAVTTTSDFEIVGDAVFLNISITILGKTFKVKSTKLTEKRQCMDNWDKENKCWKDDNADVMSLIEMVRKHGSAMVNEHVEAEVRFGKAGEKNTAKRDPLEDFLKMQAQAQAVVPA